eukprot:353880-Chlamydomonas_euryale.AAC.4
MRRLGGPAGGRLLAGSCAAAAPCVCWPARCLSSNEPSRRLPGRSCVSAARARGTGTHRCRSAIVGVAVGMALLPPGGLELGEAAGYLQGPGALCMPRASAVEPPRALPGAAAVLCRRGMARHTGVRPRRVNGRLRGFWSDVTPQRGSTQKAAQAVRAADPCTVVASAARARWLASTRKSAEKGRPARTCACVG